MKRIAILGLILILILSGGWCYWKFFLETKEFGIVNEMQDLGAVPEISLGDITSGRLMRFWYGELKKGNIKPLPETARPLSEYVINELMYKNWGYKYIELKYDDITGGKYLYTRDFPYRLEAVYKIRFGNKLHYLLMLQWLNKDKSVSFVPVVVPQEKFGVDGVMDENLTRVMEIDPKFFVSPVIMIKDVNSCGKIYFASQEYCRWYMNNGWLENLSGKWKEGLIPKETTRMPRLFVISKARYK